MTISGISSMFSEYFAVVPGSFGLHPRAHPNSVMESVRASERPPPAEAASCLARCHSLAADTRPFQVTQGPFDRSIVFLVYEAMLNGGMDLRNYYMVRARNNLMRHRQRVSCCDATERATKKTDRNGALPPISTRQPFSSSSSLTLHCCGNSRILHTVCGEEVTRLSELYLKYSKTMQLVAPTQSLACSLNKPGLC